ncbi:MAG: DUF2971 domain-containing protein [Defluviicoccus sp.]|nr:DUF2971 domain-containing protein [Defluviicoccus sp.]MDE0279115.1 DUF2971 domain-containing protein [Defluviicoccus sp.]
MAGLLSKFFPSYEEMADALFHYTNANGLLGILESGQLWSTASVASNDATEQQYGKGVIASVLNTIPKNASEQRRIDAALESLRLPPFAATHDYDEDLEALLTTHFVTFITSFCKTSDPAIFQGGLLSQWRAYGGTHGYAIQFSRNALSTWLDDIEGDGPKPVLEDVHYGQENPIKQEIMHTAASISTMFTTYVEKRVEKKGESNERGEAAFCSVTDDTLGDSAWDVFKTYSRFLRYTKHPAFKEEEEVRLSQESLLSELPKPSPVRAFVRDSALVPYVTTPTAVTDEQKTLLLNSIKAVIVGPSPDAYIRARSLEFFLRVRKLDRIDVRTSTIPLV